MTELVLDVKQQEAVRACTDRTRRLVGVTGRAGTGKTTIIRTVVGVLEGAGFTVTLAAPTGKAAKRIKEATGIAAQTFHRLLEFTSPGEPDPKTGKPMWVTMPRRHRSNPLPYDVVIGDEYAMINQELHGDITGAIKPGGRLLTFGDVNQLAPIEQSAILAKQESKFSEILRKFNGVTLETIHRTGAGSGIADNGGRVLRGMAPVRRDDFMVSVGSTPVDTVLRYVREHREHFASVDSQVITPTNVSWVGAYKLNVAIQSMLHSSSKGWLELARHEWESKRPVRIRVGDKVVVGKNLYSINCNDGTQGVFNGETGIVTRITGGDVEVDLGDRVCVLPPQMRVQIGEQVKTIYPHREIHLAYALTTHKCQGSEYRKVVYVMNKSQTMQLTRPNLYTGITRAREHVHLVTDLPSLSRACMTLVSPIAGGH